MNTKSIETQLSADLETSVKIEPIYNANFKDEISDATQKFSVQTSSGTEFFLIISGHGNPLLMNRAVENIQSARVNVSAGVAKHILQPVATGADELLSYAVWPAKKPFPSKGRLNRIFARTRFAKPVLEWNKNLTCETLTDADISVTQANLQAIHGDEALPERMREDTLRAEQRMQAGTWQPKNCIQHGDFWSGNILLPTGPQDASFYIIDWAGMQGDGYPFLDLARMLMSLRCRYRISADHIDDLGNRVNCDRSDVISYTLSGLGHVRRNLEYFPLDRYRYMAVKVYEFIKSHQKNKTSIQ